MSKTWQAHARHILDAIGRIRLIDSRGDLTQDVVLYDAALRNLQTLSESTQQRPKAMKEAHPEIPWRQISGFRNILVHNYLGDIDPLTIASVIERNLQPLEDCVQTMLDSDLPNNREQ
ncbi:MULTISPECIES: HepT-like ribonuclease domain-containing protein [Thiorhodovibrio]|uniref:HepT-like ribonuclease domain-containing protein n=1 Tax=Thiorhodovibrio TaxID=61593 RepID=UPI0019146A67|nr:MULTISPECIES: HepT-like ribonuclease domain-containing protein [Thiorhodovibrio]MBK5970388.1 hypothetical protein [Thiorhodovibrio winogradskyi]WPL14309.1 hypothetical protein Thiosp_04146 [Thiorhodovibrio litoralis]